MKKYLIPILSLFSCPLLMGQGSVHTPLGDIAITNEQSFGIYVSNNKKLKLEKIFVTIANDEFSTESFEVVVFSAPKMNSSKTYDKKRFKQLNSTPIMSVGQNAGGKIELDVSDMNIRISKNFIIKLRPSQKSMENPRTREEKVYECGKEGFQYTGKMKTVSSYGPKFCRSEAYPMLFSFSREGDSYTISPAEAPAIEFSAKEDD